MSFPFNKTFLNAVTSETIDGIGIIRIEDYLAAITPDWKAKKAVHLWGDILASVSEISYQVSLYLDDALVMNEELGLYWHQGLCKAAKSAQALDVGHVIVGRPLLGKPFIGQIKPL